MFEKVIVVKLLVRIMTDDGTHMQLKNATNNDDYDDDDDFDDDQPIWTETAWDWLCRSQSSKSIVPAVDPITAAQRFCQGDTGIPFLDYVLQQSQTRMSHDNISIQKQTMSMNSRRRRRRNGDGFKIFTTPLIELWESNVGNSNLTVSSCSTITATLVSLIARYVESTRISKFSKEKSTTIVSNPKRIPQVVILDPWHEISISKVVVAIRNILWLEKQQDGISTNNKDENNNHNSNNNENDDFCNDDIHQCLERIHYVVWSDTTEALAGLEVLLTTMMQQSSKDPSVITPSTTPLLLVWDGFRTVLRNDTYGCQEVMRQLLRFWRQTSSFIVLTGMYRSMTTTVHRSRVISSSSFLLSKNSNDWEEAICRIQLEQHSNEKNQKNDDDDTGDNQQQPKQHRRKAILKLGDSEMEFFFTVGSGGILLS
jgi:hypothetical protein